MKPKKDLLADGIGLHYNRIMGASTINNLNRNLMIKIGIDQNKAQRMTNQGSRKCLATKVGGKTNLSDKAKASCLGHTNISTSSGFYQCAKNHEVAAEIQNAIAPVPFYSPPIVQNPYLVSSKNIIYNF